MNFQEAEKAYKDLRSQHAAGKMTDADFEAQVNQLKVQDPQGRWWQLGVRTGEWYFNDGQKWVKGKPPVEVTPPPAPTEEKPAPAPTPAPMPAPAPTPMPTPTMESKPAVTTPPPATEEKTERASIMPRGIFAAKPEGSSGGGGLPKPILIGIIAVGVVLLLAVLVGAYFLFGRGLGGTTAARTPTTAPQIAVASPTQAVVQVTATSAPTNTPEATATLVITPTNTAPAVRPTNTRGAVAPARTNTPAKAPAATNTPPPPPGFFVTKIVTDKPNPDPNERFGFVVSFLNNNAPPSFFGRDVKWFLGVSRINDQDKLFGQTEQKTLEIRNGSYTLTLPQSFSVGASGAPDCNYVIMAYYFDELGVRQKFTSTDGKPFQLRFDMCK